MLATTYDPTNVAGDAFAMDNMVQGSTNYFVTSLDMTNLSNLSGTNTGDQTNITGNAGTATALQTARTIGGVSFDGTANITVASATGAFAVSGAFTANGGISIAANALTGTTGIIDYTNFDVDASGNADIGGTITSGSSNIAVTLATGFVDADALTLTAAVDGGTGTSSGSGLMARSDGIGLLQGCTDGQVLKWVESTDTWDCAADSTGGGGVPNMNYVADTNISAIAASNNNTTEYWDDATRPSIIPSASSSEVLVMVTYTWAWTGAGAEEVFARIERDATGSNPTCGSDTAVGVEIGGGSSDIFNGSATGIFVDAPGVATQVRYTLCSSSLSSATPTATMGDAHFTLYEINDAADLAEIYSTNDSSIGMGDVVSLDSSLTAGVKKSEGINDRGVLGIVSSKPAMVIGGTNGEGVSAVPVALSGRVPVKVITENGAIEAGDYLTSSSVPGVAMKSNGVGSVIGQAMSAYNAEGIGIVVAFVKNFDLGEIGETALLLGDVSPVANADGTDNGLSTLVAEIQAETARDPVLIIGEKISDGKQFLTDFVVARVTAIRGYFDEIFAKKIHTEQICVKKSDGSEVCANGDQFDTLLQNAGITPAPDPIPLPVDPMPRPLPIDPKPKPNPNPEPGPVLDPIPEVVPEPIPNPVPVEPEVIPDPTPTAPPAEQPTNSIEAELLQ